MNFVLTGQVAALLCTVQCRSAECVWTNCLPLQPHRCRFQFVSVISLLQYIAQLSLCSAVNCCLPCSQPLDCSRPRCSVVCVWDAVWDVDAGDAVPSVLWHCWLGGRKSIRPVKSWVVGCWHGYQSGARCRLAYHPADATATHCLLLQ